MRAIVAGAALLTLAVGGCGADGEGRADASDGTTTTTTTDPAWAPPGTDIGLGLVVPEGTWLAGPVFHRPAVVVMDEIRPEGDELVALLVVEGDPFTVMDDVAAQIRDLGPEAPGSGAACAWQGSDIPDDGEATIGDSSVRADQVEALTCDIAASDQTISVIAHLRRGRGLAGSLLLTASAHATEIDLEQHADPAGSPDPAPEGARDLLPDPAPREQPAAGDEFGGTANCFGDVERGRLTLPPGARLVGTQGAGDGASVLAVDDLGAAMDALADSALGPRQEWEHETDEELALADGTAVRSRHWSIGGGGGACSLLGSPDGRHLLITMHSD